MYYYQALMDASSLPQDSSDIFFLGGLLLLPCVKHILFIGSLLLFLGLRTVTLAVCFSSINFFVSSGSEGYIGISVKWFNQSGSFMRMGYELLLLSFLFSFFAWAALITTDGPCPSRTNILLYRFIATT